MFSQTIPAGCRKLSTGSKHCGPNSVSFIARGFHVLATIWESYEDRYLLVMVVHAHHVIVAAQLAEGATDPNIPFSHLFLIQS